MLLPKRVKYRRVHRGRLTGKALRGNQVTYGEYGLVAVSYTHLDVYKRQTARYAMKREVAAGSAGFFR